MFPTKPAVPLALLSQYNYFYYHYYIYCLPVYCYHYYITKVSLNNTHN
jgi:hypothetical protein